MRSIEDTYAIVMNVYGRWVLLVIGAPYVGALDEDCLKFLFMGSLLFFGRTNFFLFYRL